MSRLRRSLLFVPASSERFFAKAQASQADTLIFDLEDAVAPDRKAIARETLKEVLQDTGFFRFERTVRINALDTPYFLDDVLAMVEAGADGLVVPKTNTVEGIRFVDTLVSLAEGRARREAGSVVLLPLIEQPEAIGNGTYATPCVRLLEDVYLKQFEQWVGRSGCETWHSGENVCFPVPKRMGRQLV